MPIYYKKVRPNPNDINFIERGGNRFAFGIRKKLAAINSRANKGEGLELGKIHNRDAAESLLYESNFSNANFSPRRLELDDNELKEQINTKYGPIIVVRQDSDISKSKPVIMTYHDIGLNHSSNFESFFSTAENKLLLQSFSLIHINAPGQHENADDLPDNYFFPTMDELSEQILDVCKHYNIESFIGFGYGAGSNVLSRFALKYPNSVDGLILINPSATTSTWTEWIYQKLNIRQLMNAIDSKSLPLSVQQYLMWHLFGNLDLPDRHVDEEAVELYRNYFAANFVNVRNLALFVESYIKRSNLIISREDKSTNFKCNVVVISGAYSAHVDESVKMNARLDPTNSSWIKLSDSAMVLEEQPQKVAQIMRLFLQGLGYTLKAYERKRAIMTGMSLPCLASSRLSLFTPPNRRSSLGAIQEV